MKRALTAACFLACIGTTALQAQNPSNPFEAPNGMVGVPYSYDYASIFAPYLSDIPSDIGFSFSFTLGSGTLPPGLTLAANTLSGTPTEPGNYSFVVYFGFTVSYMGMSYAYGPYTLPSGAVITGNAGPSVTVAPGALIFSLTQGSTSAVSQSVVLSSSSETPQSFTVSASTSSGGNWLSASPSSGALAGVGASSISVTVDPTNLSEGTYLGTVSISVSPANQQFAVNVTATVSGGQAQLQVSQSGVRFQTVAGGANPPSQSVTVLNGGSGSLNLSLSTSTTSGGNWLSAASSSSTVSSSSSATVTISATVAGLAAGDYYGQVQISANGAANSPQTVSVVLNIAAADADLGAFVNPTGLIFIGQAGGSDPPSQIISVTNPSPSALTYTAGINFGQGNSWFTVSPGGGLVSSASPVTLTVQPMITGVASGVYFGTIQLNFSDGSTREIAVVLIVVPGAAEETAHARTTQTASSCTPSKLIPVFTQLGNDFSTVAAWPTPIAVTVVDDCGNFLTAGSVTASFSDGDPSLPLTSLNNGNWSATWQPRNSSAQVVITVAAVEAAPPLSGTQIIGGTLQSNPTTPSINAGGVVSAAKSAQNQPLAPGAFTSIYGVHLGAGQNPALSLPLATQLGATQVILAGRALPLQYAADGQVNAVIPYDIAANSTQQLIVANGPALSVPQPVVIAPAQPAVFDGSIKDYKPGSQTPVTVDENHPISAGDVIVISCAGLGAVEPAVTAGTAAPSSPPAKTKNPVTVTIGGKNAPVVFAGLAPGFAGLYQVNVQVPAGITAGNQVPLVISVMGFESAPVTVAVK